MLIMLVLIKSKKKFARLRIYAQVIRHYKRRGNIMPELRNWKDVLVIQRDPELGCIPTSYEWMLRVSKVRGVNLENFQEEFNLQAQGKADNNFNSIADAVEEKYPHIKIKRKSFD